ncbi:40277_t:CDS:1, partial [Gigaspora margarita]
SIKRLEHKRNKFKMFNFETAKLDEFYDDHVQKIIDADLIGI